MTQRKRLILFPDSNLFFQFRAASQLPWKEIGDYDEIELIVCRPVQKEIDRHKGGGNDRRQRRARQAASILREVIKNNGTPQTLCQGPPEVKLSLRVDLKPDQDLADKLNYAEPDDTLVGIAQGFATTSDADVAVLTDDTGVMASAGTVSLNYIPIPDEWRLEPEASREAKELKSAQAEIARLQRLEPAFDVDCFDSKGNSVPSLEFQFPKANPLTQQEIIGLIEHARLLFPYKTDFSTPARNTSTPGRAGISLEALRGMRMPPTDQQITEYKKGYEEWLVKLETALEKVHSRLIRDKADGSFSFSARNIGTRPANDILVEIIAHGPFLVGRPPKKNEHEKDSTVLPSPPALPEFRVSKIDTMFHMSVLPDILAYWGRL